MALHIAIFVMLLDLIRNGLRVSLLHISAVIYGDKFVIFRNDRLHEFAYHVGNIGSGVCNGAIVQANDIAGLNVHAIPFAVPYGIGNHACLHPLCSFLHAFGVFLAAHLRLESDSCCNAHGNVLRGNDVNFLFGQFRRLLRSLVKWYGYVSQVARMFDEELHKENVFCAYLLKLLPPDEVSPLDLEGKLQLEYYKLQKTFAGAIELEHAKGVYEPVTQKGALGHDPKEPLDEIILKINEKFKGEFTNADRVLLTALHDRLLADPKLAKLARSSDPQIFTESIFPKAFDTAAQDSYLEAQDTFSSLFEDTSKYKAIMSALAEWLYGEFRKK